MQTSLSKVSFFFLLLLPTWAWSQEVRIELGPDEVAENRMFTITLTVVNESLKNYSDFPEIPGFIKRGTSSSYSTNIINGQVSSTHSITQNYIPRSRGVFELSPFEMTVNNKKVKSPGKKIKVVAPGQQQQRQADPFSTDPFQDFFGRSNEPTEFVEVKDDAFFALSVSKDEVYVGEGFTATLAFYVAETNRASLQFYDLSNQLSDMLKKIKPASCWEENFNIENITEETVVINGKRYAQYKLYQAVFYPLNLTAIEFPALPFKMIKFKESKTRNFFGRSRQEDYKTYYSQAKQVKVKDLPAHPLKDLVAVGDYRLSEEISTTDAQTGEGVQYQYTIYGEGNISAIDEPLRPQDGDVEFYAPTVRQDVTRANGRVRGKKTFSYFINPTIPGTYQLADYLPWVFFNPRLNRYDTLLPESYIHVKGDAIQKALSLPNKKEAESIYGLIDTADNTLRSREDSKAYTYGFYGSIALLLIASGFFFFRKYA